MKEKLRTLFLAFLFTGIILFLIGTYFSMFKAGLPYQDPTTEMTIHWMSYSIAGKTCIIYGAIFLAIGIIGKISCKIIKLPTK